MTCKQVLALMNALPLAEYPLAQLEAAERHARNCSKCKPVVTSSKALDFQLSRLPEPAPPAGLEAAILKRIALQGRAAASEVRENQRFPLRLDGSGCDPSRSAESHVLKKIWLKSKDRS